MANIIIVSSKKYLHSIIFIQVYNMHVCVEIPKSEREKEWYAGTAWSDVRDTPQKFDTTHSFRQKPRFDLWSSRRVVYSRNGKQRPRKSCNAYVFGRIIISVRYCMSRKYISQNMLSITRDRTSRENQTKTSSTLYVPIKHHICYLRVKCAWVLQYRI